MEHAVICGCDAPVNRVGLTRQAMAFLTEPSFIHSLIHVTEGARALTCFNLSTSVANPSPLIQRSCTDLFSLFNIIKKKKRNFSFLFCISCFDSDLFVGFAKLSKPLLSFFNKALFDYVFPIFSPSHLVLSLSLSLSISPYSLFIFLGSDLLFF